MSDAGAELIASIRDVSHQLANDVAVVHYNLQFLAESVEGMGEPGKSALSDALVAGDRLVNITRRLQILLGVSAIVGPSEGR